ncbi:MAG: exodeoxyribonuclease V subunit gamma [Clostridia bacterium]|nr:exodeoxyribonuclease V subunit gamma [Clostridia bacterium]
MYDINDLNQVQKAVTYDTDGAILVSAGAGSGKTRLLTHRIAYLIDEKGVNPENILAITFTNKATNEMRERITSMVESAKYVWVSTFHSMCARILRENISNLPGYNRFFTIYDESDTKKLIKKVIKELNLEDEKLDDVDCHISNAKNMGYDPQEYSKEFGYYDNIDTITKVYTEYEKQLHDNNALDFDDLLIKTLYLLNNVQGVREYYQQKFHYILVDEFQDTNLVQYKIVRILSAKHGNIFVVGDEDQSIYGWRGANIGNIRDFISDFPNCKVYKLEQNYRSTKNILSSANKLIANNNSRIEKTLFTNNELGDDVVLYGAYDESDECDWVARHIHALISNGVSCNEIGVLMRISSLSRIMEEKLLNYNIPYKVSGIFKFFERAEIKNIIAYMSCVVNEHDSVSLSRIINFPKRGIGDSSIETLAQTAYDNGVSMLNVVLNCEKYNLSTALCNKLQPFIHIMNELFATIDTMTITDWVKNLLKITGINELYNTKSEEDVTRKLNIESFVQSVATFEHDNSNDSVADYLQSVTLQNDLSEDDTTNSVSVSTVHASKGLEFKYVFIIGAEDGIFPLSRSMDEHDDLEEERRLMYVAITRAKIKLYVSYAKSRFLYGKRNYTIISRFVKEMGLQKEREKRVDYGASYNTNSPFKLNKISTENSNIKYDNDMWKNKISKQNDKYSEYKVGELVLHPKFGVGTIIKTELIGDNSFVSVDFKGIGVKTLSLSFAPLQLIKKR